MDIISHLLCGIAIAVFLDARGDISSLQQILIIAGSVTPDLLFSPSFRSLSKQTGKKIRHLRKDDWRNLKETVPVWKRTYDMSHGLPALFAVSCLEMAITGSIFFGIGWMSHFFYDLFSHKEEWSIKYLYPLADRQFSHGLANPWSWPVRAMALSWVAHIILIMKII